MVALIDGQPRVLNLKEMLQAFLAHRREVVTRRTLFDLREARKKAHIQEGLAVALSNVDEIIALIKKSQTPPEAKVALMAKAWKSPVVEEMLKRAGGRTSVPQIFIDGEHIGGCDDLHALDRAGKLDPKLGRATP